MTQAIRTPAKGAGEHLESGKTHLGQARKEPRTYLLIGSGRLFKHLQTYFQFLAETNPDFKLLTWDRHQDPHALNRKLNEATHVLLAIKDSALLSFYEQYIAGLELICVHFSAATSVPGTYSAHPLMTFSDSFYDFSFYKQIQFVVRSDAQAISSLQDVLPDLPNSSSLIPADQGAHYHALCVMAGNFPQILWQKVAREFASLQIPEAALNLYLQQVLENFLANPKAALTGPLVRNDQKTIQANLKSLEQDAYQVVYQSFVSAYNFENLKNSNSNSPQAREVSNEASTI